LTVIEKVRSFRPLPAFDLGEDVVEPERGLRPFPRGVGSSPGRQYESGEGRARRMARVLFTGTPFRIR